MAIGDPNIANGDGAVALGRDNQATGIGAVALGDTNIVNGNGAVGLGERNTVSGVAALGIGSYNDLTGESSLALGALNSLRGERAIALGMDNRVTGDGTLAVGNSVEILGNDALAIGNNSRAMAISAVAFGNRSNASGQNATAIGTEAVAGDFGTSLGERAVAGLAAIAIGPISLASGIASVTLGVGAQALAEGSVALGSSARAARGGVTGYSAFGLLDPQSSAGEINIGRVIPRPDAPPDDIPLGERQITGVAAGSADTDAVNVAQLRGITANLGEATAAALGGGSSYDPGLGTISSPLYIVSGASYSNVADALSDLVTKVEQAADQGITYDSLSKDRVTLAGTSGTVIGNVANGAVTETSSEAINGAQLANTNRSVARNDTAIRTLTGTLSGSTISPVQYADANTPTVANGGTLTNDVTLIGAAPADPVGLHNIAAGRIEAGSTDAVNGGQVAQVAAVADNSVQYDRAPTGERLDRITLAGGGAASPVALDNVADARLDESSTEAVNGRQLNATNSALARNVSATQAALATAREADTRSRNAVAYDAGANAVTLVSPDAVPQKGPVALRNVARGTAPTDAVNVDQLIEGMSLSVATANAYTDAQVDLLDFRLDDLRRDSEAGTAAAMAIGQIPALDEGTMIGGGVGTWQGESAMALGLSHSSSDGRFSVRAAATYTTRGQAGAAAGVGIALN